MKKKRIQIISSCKIHYVKKMWYHSDPIEMMEWNNMSACAYGIRLKLLLRRQMEINHDYKIEEATWGFFVCKDYEKFLPSSQIDILFGGSSIF